MDYFTYPPDTDSSIPTSEKEPLSSTEHPPLVGGQEGGEGCGPLLRNSDGSVSGGEGRSPSRGAVSGAVELVQPSVLHGGKNGRGRYEDYALANRCLADPRFTFSKEQLEKLSLQAYKDATDEEAPAKIRQMALRTCVLMVACNYKLDALQMKDVHHVERLTAREVEDTINDPAVREAMRAARRRLMAPPDQQGG